MKLEGSWSDLERRGFVVARGFLDAKEIDAQRAAFSRASTEGWRETGFSFLLEASAEAPLRERIEALLPEIRGATRLALHGVRKGGHTFSTVAPGPDSRPVVHDWHTDRNPYYVHQNVYDYLNFWMPIVKPSARASGLLLVPMDQLSRRAPPLHEALEGKGGAEIRGDRIVFDVDERTCVARCPFDPFELAVAPEVEPGDAILARGDVLHRTQDTSSHRVAISLRACSFTQPISKAKLFTMSPRKRAHVSLDTRVVRRMFGEVVAAFWRRRANEVAYAEIEALRDDVRRGEPEARRLFEAATRFWPLLLRPREDVRATNGASQPRSRPG